MSSSKFGWRFAGAEKAKGLVPRIGSAENVGTMMTPRVADTEALVELARSRGLFCMEAVWTLALPRYVTEENGQKRFDHQKLYDVTYHATLNLNKVIDVNYYPVVEAERSNKRHRPIGLGVQGLADTFIALRMPFESEEAAGLNKDIFETIYFA